MPRGNVDVDLDQYVVEQIFYTSRDGTRVPMFLVRHVDMPRDGTNPTLLYGYGGFDISLTPYFSPARLAWLEMGGLLAIPNLRGGGEYGREWHQAGTKTSKQNVFDDFIAAAEWLIEQNWTTPDCLAIQGGSNGGLLVGACMTQRPDLFGACLPAVGVLDMLRFHLFTIGAAWQGDYGDVEKEPEFRALHAYSPYHNLTDGTSYPATMITTGDTDDRVVPGHSFKYAAALQHAHAGDAPVLPAPVAAWMALPRLPVGMHNPRPTAAHGQPRVCGRGHQRPAHHPDHDLSADPRRAQGLCADAHLLGRPAGP